MRRASGVVLVGSANGPSLRSLDGGVTFAPWTTAPHVRALGERGLAITRFKGLGEMDPEELWATTLDPQKRTLLRVHLEDALKADDMFRTLMGEKVEPRRNWLVESSARVDQAAIDI